MLFPARTLFQLTLGGRTGRLVQTAPEPPNPTAPDTTLAPSTTSAPPSDPDPFVEPSTDGVGITRAASDVIGDAFGNLVDNGFQTGTAVIITTIALISMRNIKVTGLIAWLVAIGAFWAGWVTYDFLFIDGTSPLFPTGVDADDFLNVVFGGPTGFLVASIVGSIAAWFLWKKDAKWYTRVLLMIGAFFSASFFYNLVEAIRIARN